MEELQKTQEYAAERERWDASLARRRHEPRELAGDGLHAVPCFLARPDLTIAGPIGNRLERSAPAGTVLAADW